MTILNMPQGQIMLYTLDEYGWIMQFLPKPWKKNKYAYPRKK